MAIGAAFSVSAIDLTRLGNTSNISQNLSNVGDDLDSDQWNLLIKDSSSEEGNN